jgi:hypothetical protein
VHHTFGKASRPRRRVQQVEVVGPEPSVGDRRRQPVASEQRSPGRRHLDRRPGTGRRDDDVVAQVRVPLSEALDQRRSRLASMLG